MGGMRIITLKAKNKHFKNILLIKNYFYNYNLEL